MSPSPESGRPRSPSEDAVHVLVIHARRQLGALEDAVNAAYRCADALQDHRSGKLYWAREGVNEARRRLFDAEPDWGKK